MYDTTEHPYNARLLGATVDGLGVVALVSSSRAYAYAHIVDDGGDVKHRFFAELNAMSVTLADELPSYIRVDAHRVSYGTWDSVYIMEDVGA